MQSKTNLPKIYLENGTIEVKFVDNPKRRLPAIDCCGVDVLLDDKVVAEVADAHVQLLKDHDVTIWTDHEPDPVQLAKRVADADGLVLFRERTKIGADLLDQLPNLKLISQRSVYPHVDVGACTQNGVMLCSK